MARIIPVGFGELSFVFTGQDGTQPFVTTLGVGLAGVGDEVNACNQAFLAYSANLLPATSDDITLDRVVLSVGLTGGVSGSVESTLDPIPGGNNGDFGVIAMAPIARKQTADLGRKGRGRCFLPGAVESNQVNRSGEIDPVLRGLLSERWNDFLLEIATPPLGGDAMSPVLLHADGSTPTVITGGSIAPLVGWIRGRIR